MQTILGAGGAIGVPLAKALKQYTREIRLVSRNPQKVNATDELFPADLLSPGEVERSIKGSSIVYVTLGLPYRYRIWKKEWPKFMANVIEACIENNCKLVFFDNVYMYDRDSLQEMKEDAPVNPSSKKGKIRAELAGMIMDKVKEGKLTALIARSADFYGPSIEASSLLTETVIKPLSRGKKANWIGSVDFKHSFTYTPDAGRATALLGNTEDAYNQVWHLPTAPRPMTGREWINAIAEELGTKPRYQEVSKTILRFIGIFVPFMRELPEMMYQYDRDYIFNSEKFEKRFSFKPTPYEEGIKEIISKDFSGGR